jgi:GT2 family glycosyltransferase
MPTAKPHPHQTLRIQTVLYRNDPEHVARAIDASARAIEHAIAAGVLHSAEFAIGDCSPFPAFDTARLAALEEKHRAQGLQRVEYQFFNANLGSAAGHNRLLASARTDLVLIQNPDVVSAPNLLVELFAPLSLPGVGLVEARQIPIEHPKDYDAVTGETGWATTACALVPRAIAERAGGFDEKTFFLYCDDVDFSWRLRLLGLKIIFQPSACVFHDKRLSHEGEWMASAAEHYYSAEATLLLAHKYSRPELVQQLLTSFDEHGNPTTRQAAAEYRKRQAEGRLPEPIDPKHRVAQFVDGYYAKHRF